ncbi:MAG: effector binding domain-containing protein [Eisenbergiella sp.]
MGIYTEYAGNENHYTIVTACETDGKETIPEGTALVTIPPGKYAKFVAKGDLHKAVAEAGRAEHGFIEA